MRLAERRGLLGGSRPLSPVQQYALEYLMILDTREQVQAEARRVGQQVALQNRQREQERAAALAEAVPIDTDEDLEDTTGEWFFDPNERWDEDRADAVLAELRGETTGRMTLTADGMPIEDA